MKQALIFLLLFLSFSFSVWAKRIPPPVILPVDDGKYRFVSLNDCIDRNESSYQGGHVVCYLKASGKKIWEKYLYSVKVNPEMELDVQDVFIMKMYLDEPNRLVLQNEKREWFVLERSTGNQLNINNFRNKDDDRSVYYFNDNRIEPLILYGYVAEGKEMPGKGNYKFWVSDLGTGRLLWEKNIFFSQPEVKQELIKKAGSDKKHPPCLYINKNKIEISYGYESKCFNIKTGKVIKSNKRDSAK